MRDQRTDPSSDSLPGFLARGVALLRDEPSVRPEWRDEVVRRATRTPSWRVSLTVPMAIAAALLFAMFGGGATYIATRWSAAAAISAQAAASGVVPVRFSVIAPRASSVAIVGDFNHWDPRSLPMRRSRDGRTWQVEVQLPLGRYTYAFLVDGKLAPDPTAPRDAGDDFGTPNSIIMVHGT